MGNTILIKHGAGAPTSEQLQPYELGFDKTDKKLYIGVEDGEPELLRPDSVAKADYADRAQYADEAQMAFADGNDSNIAETYIKQIALKEERNESGELLPTTTLILTKGNEEKIELNIYNLLVAMADTAEVANEAIWADKARWADKTNTTEKATYAQYATLIGDGTETEKWSRGDTLLPIFLDEGEFRACEEYMIPFALPHYGIDFPNQDDGKPDGTVYFKIMELN